MRTNRFESKFAVIAVLCSCAAFACAETLYLGSYGTAGGDPGFGNSATSYSFSESGKQAGNIQPVAGSPDTYNLRPDSRWAVPLSVGGTASRFVSLDPGTSGAVVEPNGTYAYHSYFNTPSALIGKGSLTVLADDTLDVFLNGQQIVTDGEFAGNTYALCSDVGPNCRAPLTIALDAGLRSAGATNDLEFVVHQDALHSTGLDFVGFISSVPEPSSLALLGTGLFGGMGAATQKIRRRK